MSEKKLTKDIFAQLKNTDEYKRSKAIAECITFLSNKIKDLEANNKTLNKNIEELIQKNNKESELNFKLKSEVKVLQKHTELYKTKLSVIEELNKTLEQTILELKTIINNDKISYNQKNEQFTSSLNKYKSIIEEMKNEKEIIINNLTKEKNDINNQKDELINELNNFKKFEEINKQLKHKIKKYEILLYKMDLENQGYKDEIQKYQNQLSTLTGQTINFIPIYKIDLNTELESIEGNDGNDDNDGNDNSKDENIETNIVNNLNNDRYINSEDINYQSNDEKNDNNENYENNNDDVNNIKNNIEDNQEINDNK